MNNRCVILTRKSQARNEKDVDSTARQEADGRAHAERRGLEVVGSFTDLESGWDRRKKRPGLEAALAAIESGKAGHLVVARGDRFTRQGPLVALELLERVKRAGGQLHILDIGDVDTTTSMGQGVYALLAATWANESEKISLRVKSATHQQVAEGAIHGGIRRFGLHRAPKSGPAACPSCHAQMKVQEIKGRAVAVIEICPVEAGLIREAAARVAAGESLRSIAVDWNARELRTVLGKRWTAQQFSKLFRSPSLRGVRVHDTRTYDDQGRQTGGAITEYPGAFPAVIDDELWTAVQVALSANVYNGGGPGRGEGSLLGGLGILRCGAPGCGALMKAASASRPGERVRYACARAPGQRGCGRVSVVRANVEDTVGMIIRDELERRRAEGTRPVDTAGLEATLADDLAAMKQLTRRMYVDRTLPEEIGLDALRELESKVADTKRTLDAIAPVQTAALVELPGDAVWGEWWCALPLEERRRKVAGIVSEVIVRPATRRGRVFETERVEVGFRPVEVA